MVQNGYPVVLELLGMRNARGFAAWVVCCLPRPQQDARRPERVGPQASPVKGKGLWPPRSA